MIWSIFFFLYYIFSTSRSNASCNIESTWKVWSRPTLCAQSWCVIYYFLSRISLLTWSQLVSSSVTHVWWSVRNLVRQKRARISLGTSARQADASVRTYCLYWWCCKKKKKKKAFSAFLFLCPCSTILAPIFWICWSLLLLRVELLVHLREATEEANGRPTSIDWNCEKDEVKPCRD